MRIELSLASGAGISYAEAMDMTEVELLACVQVVNDWNEKNPPVRF